MTRPKADPELVHGHGHQVHDEHHEDDRRQAPATSVRSATRRLGSSPSAMSGRSGPNDSTNASERGIGCRTGRAEVQRSSGTFSYLVDAMPIPARPRRARLPRRAASPDNESGTRHHRPSTAKAYTAQSSPPKTGSSRPRHPGRAPRFRWLPRRHRAHRQLRPAARRARGAYDIECCGVYHIARGRLSMRSPPTPRDSASTLRSLNPPGPGLAA